MSTNQTEHYGLHLWEPEDAFLRAEFNENTEKADAAIQEVADYAKANRNALEPMGRNLYDIIMQRYYEGKSMAYSQGLIFDTFQDNKRIASMTGGMYLGEEGLYLPGPNAVGTMTRTGAVLDKGWARAIVWIHYAGGIPTASINGSPMVHRDAHSIHLPDGRRCVERVLTLEAPGNNVVNFSLTIDTLSYNNMVQIFGYGVMFF